MASQTNEEIIAFLKDSVEPLKNDIVGDGYRAAAYLVDGTYLPCVIFRNAKTIVDLAMRRFEQERSGRGIFSKTYGLGYADIVKSFVAKGNCINAYDIERVEKSAFAFPLSVLEQIHGETTMGWTGFAAKMRDGKYFGFGTTFLYEFFQMPKGYSTDDISEIENHSYVLDTGELKSHKEEFQTRPNDYKNAVVYRERPFFECYLDNL